MCHFAWVKHEANKAFLQAFGEHLRKLREERELSIRQLAAQCDIEHSQIYRIETGEINTTISMVQKIAEGLEISHHDLFNFKFPGKTKKQGTSRANSNKTPIISTIAPLNAMPRWNTSKYLVLTCGVW